MKKNIILSLLITLLFPLIASAGTSDIQVTSAEIVAGIDTASLSWENPQEYSFRKIIIFRSSIPIEDYFSYEAVEALCNKVYEGRSETFTDIGLAENLKYYYVIFTQDRSGEYAKATILEKELFKGEQNGAEENNSNAQTQKNTLAGASSDTVNKVSWNEAGTVYSYNQKIETDYNTEEGNEPGRLALFIIVKSPHFLSEDDKNSISYFIHEGTPTTILLGSGERAGVLNSYLSVYDKLPRNTLEWQDIIKISNGRWPEERNEESEKQASEEFFSAIYERSPDMDNPNDNAAVTVIAYGLRPAARNMASEKNAIQIYRSIFGTSPTEATDWDLVRAIAYSGATR